MEKLKMASWQVFQGFLNITGGGFWQSIITSTIFKPFGFTLGQQFKTVLSNIQDINKQFHITIYSH